MIITLANAIYPTEIILQTCYQFIDLAYFFIDLDEAGKKVAVKITFKKDFKNKTSLKEFRGKFLEELLHASLRHVINEKNQKLREYIVGSALFSHNPAQAGVTAPEDVNLEEVSKIPQGPLNDPYGIAIPWEQLNGK